MPTVETNDIRMYYEELGGGEPLLCLMGITAPGSVWERHVEAWSRDFRCIMPDNRGVGQTDDLDFRHAEGFRISRLYRHLDGLQAIEDCPQDTYRHPMADSMRGGASEGTRKTSEKVRANRYRGTSNGNARFSVGGRNSGWSPDARYSMSATVSSSEAGRFFKMRAPYAKRSVDSGTWGSL